MTAELCLEKENKRKYEIVTSTLATLAFYGISCTPLAQGPVPQTVILGLLLVSTVFFNLIAGREATR